MDAFRRVTRGSSSKSKECGKMAEEVQHPTVHEVEEEQFFGEQGTSYACKKLPKNAPHIHCIVSHDIKSKLTDKLTPEQYNYFCESTCFGQYMKIRKCVGQGQIHRCCMSREVEASSKQALLIKVNGVILKFTIRTFALITGLNCVGVVEDFKFNTEEPNRLIVQYFGGNETIRRSDLYDRFNGKVWGDNDDDAIKFAILFFIHMFVYSGETKSLRIPRLHFDLVESGRYMHYPWGIKAFEWLLQSMNKVLTTDGQYYRICGMPVALQIWIYECMGKRQTNFARKISDRIPRILNWQTVGAQPRFKTLMKNTFNDGNREIKWKNVVPSLMEIAVLQLPPDGLQKSTEGVQTEPHRDIDEQVLSGQNSDDDFVDPPPPSMKVTGKRKKGQSVSPAKRVRKNDSNMTDQMEQNEKIDPVANQNVEKVGIRKVVRKKKKLSFKKKTTPTCVPTKDSQIPSISVSHEQLMRNELSELRKEVREEFKDIRKLINDNFNIIMSSLKDQKNNDNAGQGSQPFTSPILSENQNQDNTNNHNAAQGRQHFTKSVDSENQNQKSEGDESSNNGSEEVFQDHSIFENSTQGDISDIADNQVDCDNSPVRNLINVDAGFSSSKSIIPSPSFVRPLVFENQHDNDEEEQFIFPTPIQSIVPLEGSPQSQFELDDELMPSLSDIKSNRATDNTINSERSIIMHNQNTSNESSNIQKKASKDSQNQKGPVHTPLHAHRIRRPGPFNTSPYITSFSSSAGTSSVQPVIFELKHPFIFDLISGHRDIVMWDAHRSWIREGLFAKHENKRHDQDRYKKGKARIPVPFDFGVDIVDNKNWFYNLYSKGQLLNDSHINVIFYYLRKKAKYDVDSRYKYTTVDCVFTSKISSIWKKYEDLDSDVCCADEEHFIGDYIRGYKVHAGIPWHLVDHVLIPVNVKEKFHWVLAVLSLNDRRVYVYDSYRAAGHDAAIRNEVTKLAQLIPLKLTMYDYYKNRGLDRSVSQEENELFEIVFIDNIPQQTGGSLDCGIYMLAFAEWLSYGQGNPSGAFDVTFLRARYATLLWNYAKQKQDNGAISDSEAPPRHAMPQSVRVVSDPIEIQ